MKARGLLLAGIVALVVVLVSGPIFSGCAKPPPPPAPPEEEVLAPPEEEEVVAPPPEGPVYGGVLNRVLFRLVPILDPAYSPPVGSDIILLTNEELFEGDWTKGPAGTGETRWNLLVHFSLPLETGCLAESWEMPDNETLVFHIRQGVRFHNKPPVNGRELVAEDVVFNIKRSFDIPTSFTRRDFAPEDWPTSVTAPDKYTVVVKCPPQSINRLLKEISTVQRIMAPEAGGKYPGDYRGWKDSCGTGPFMLVDYIDASSATLVRNPNYWMKDPLHPENTLPYLDGVKLLIIPDRSTRLAALRTGKIDAHEDLTWEDRDALLKTNPELQWAPLANIKFTILGMRVDTRPFDDIRVRRALAMAIDNQAIVKDYYGGNAEILTWPVMPVEEFKAMFTPLDELPESVRELYEYHPDKARQLLAEAGYPDGFKTEIVCIQMEVDQLSIIKAYWADIGVDLELKVYETPVLRSIFLEQAYKQMACGGGAAAMPGELAETRTGGMGTKNLSIVSDPYIDEKYPELREAMLDWGKTSQIMKEVAPYILENCWYIQPPAPHFFTFWQPWLKGYDGEFSVGYMGIGLWPKYVWLDQELKKEMTGR